MSIVRMKKMFLVSHENERAKILKIFMTSGCVEISTPISDEKKQTFEKEYRRNIESKMLRVSFALTFLRESGKEIIKLDEKAAIANLKRENRLVSIEEYEASGAEEAETLAKIAELEAINAKLIDLKGERAKYIALKEQLSVYLPLNIHFSAIQDTKNVTVFLGTVPVQRVEELKTGLENIAEFEVFNGQKSACVCAFSHNGDVAAVKTVLMQSEFAKCPFSYRLTAAEKTAEIDSAVLDIDKKRDELYLKIAAFDVLSRFKLLYDYYALEISKLDAVAACESTQKTIVFEAWVPANKTEGLQKKIESNCKYAEIMFRDPIGGEIPPTLTHNAPLTGAFGGITEMFASPSYNERDPNPFVAFFYFLFFGVMMGDAGYGILIALACFIYLKVKKPVKNSGKMIVMFGLCGLATVIWGLFFGGWFAIELPAGSFFAKATWFNPLNEPLKMFMLALGLGALQLGTGYFLKALAEIKAGNPLKGILSNFSWVLIFIALFLISPVLMNFLGAIKVDPAPAWFGVLSKIGMIIALIGATMLVVGGAVGKKNPVKMVTGALGQAYGAINVVSDLLSYSRLFGLGLATGVIGYVINLLADIIVNTFFNGLWVGWIIAVPVLIIGHGFNLGINLLGAYVHDSRLQYIEFFGKFFEGNGRAFNALGNKTKYTFFKN